MVSLLCKERNWDSHLITSVIKGHAAGTWQSLILPKVDSSDFQACVYLFSFSIPPPFCPLLPSFPLLFSLLPHADTFQVCQSELLTTFIPGLGNTKVIFDHPLGYFSMARVFHDRVDGTVSSDLIP